MISASDNMATDLLIGRVGTGAVERALVTAGHHDPASMTPFPTMHQVFSVGWGEPNLREQWKNASREDRIKLLQQTDSRPYQPDPNRTHSPGSTDGLEWYGSAQDICRVHAALQASAVGPAAPVKDILSALPGIDLDPAKWTYIGAKGGTCRRPDVQLVRGGPHRTAVGGELPAELAAVPQFDRGGLAAADRQAGLRARARGPAPLTRQLLRNVQASAR